MCKSDMEYLIYWPSVTLLLKYHATAHVEHMQASQQMSLTLSASLSKSAHGNALHTLSFARGVIKREVVTASIALACVRVILWPHP